MPYKSSARRIWRLALENKGAWERERLLIVLLDGRERVVGVGEVPAGGATSAHVRAILRDIPPGKAVGFISVHSQPGESPPPNDTALVARLEAIAEEIGLPLLDHVRFRGGRCQSTVGR